MKRLPSGLDGLGELVPGTDVRAQRSPRFLKLTGPCGDFHVLTAAEARALAQWIMEQVPEPASSFREGWMEATA